MARPKKEINWEQFEELCHIQCTQSEIANVLLINRETLAIKVKEHYGEDFPSVYTRYSDAGKKSLRRYQFALAKKNASMAIWLGKHWLGQCDLKEEIKGLIDDEFRAAIREIQESARNAALSESRMANEPPVPHQECPGPTPSIPDELDAKGTMGEPPLL